MQRMYLYVSLISVYTQNIHLRNDIVHIHTVHRERFSSVLFMRQDWVHNRMNESVCVWRQGEKTNALRWTHTTHSAQTTYTHACYWRERERERGGGKEFCKKCLSNSAWKMYPLIDLLCPHFFLQEGEANILCKGEHAYILGIQSRFTLIATLLWCFVFFSRHLLSSVLCDVLWCAPAILCVSLQRVRICIALTVMTTIDRQESNSATVHGRQFKFK